MLTHPYIDFFAHISRQRLDALNDLTTDDVIFQDPFHKTQGREAFRTILLKMFDMLSDPKFIIKSGAAADTEMFVAWEFTAQTRRISRPIFLVGVSEIRFANNRVSHHIDYWDAASQVYEKIPFFGPIIKSIRTFVFDRHSTIISNPRKRYSEC